MGRGVYFDSCFFFSLVKLIAKVRYSIHQIAPPLLLKMYKNLAYTNLTFCAYGEHIFLTKANDSRNKSALNSMSSLSFCRKKEIYSPFVAWSLNVTFISIVKLLFYFHVSQTVLGIPRNRLGHIPLKYQILQP